MRLRHLLALALAAVIAPPTRAVDLNVITAVEVKQEGGTVVLAVKGSRKPSFTTFSMADPPRFVIDFSESRFQGVPEDLRVDDGVIGLVKSLSYGSDATSVARVVIAFQAEVPPPVVEDADATLLVRVERPAGVAAVASADEAVAREKKERQEAEKRAREEAEAQARAERAAAEASAQQARAEVKARAEAEAAAARAREAEARAQAEADAVRAREQKARAEAEAAAARTREAEARAQTEADAVRAREEEKARAEAQAAAGRAREAEARAQAEAEAVRAREEKARAEAAAARTRDADARAQAEADAVRAREEKARAEAEAIRGREDEKARAEAEARVEAEARSAARRAVPTGGEPVDPAAQALNPAPVVAVSPAPAAAVEPPPAQPAPAAPAAPAAVPPEPPPAPPARAMTAAVEPPAAPPRAPARATDERPALAAPVRSAVPATTGRRAAAPRARLSEVGFRQSAGVSRVFVRTSVTPRFTIQDLGENVIRVELENTRAVRRNDLRFLDTSYFSSAVAMIRPARRGSTYVLDIRLKERVPYQQKLEGDVLAIDFERPAPPVSSQRAGVTPEPATAAAPAEPAR